MLAVYHPETDQSMKYITRVEVVYGDSSNAIDGEDINKGFGGEDVYLVPKYTTSRAEAALGFSFHSSYVKDLNAADISKGDGRELYRYIHTHYRPGGPSGGYRPVGRVYLRESPMGDGHTDDLNKHRGGRDLYLCWTYAT
ncbi:hypothetical protein BJY52DRAFT_1292942 [Lactarius psammicola]|nr:hypothetical protein BJY52DRAFT_1292942 [Lactarius psammicola]